MNENQHPPQPHPEQDPIQHLDFEPQLPPEAQVDEAEAIVAGAHQQIQTENWGRVIPSAKSPQELLAEMESPDNHQGKSLRPGGQAQDRQNPLTDPKNWGKRIPPDQLQ